MIGALKVVFTQKKRDGFDFDLNIHELFNIGICQ